MTVVELSRWQFGITTVYHFIFVPLTLSLSYLVAIMQTLWRVKKDDVYLRMTKFFGKIFLINFAVGVVTGIVQEFQCSSASPRRGPARSAGCRWP